MRARQACASPFYLQKKKIKIEKINIPDIFIPVIKMESHEHNGIICFGRDPQLWDV
jgi:hypothetical protein